MAEATIKLRGWQGVAAIVVLVAVVVIRLVTFRDMTDDAKLMRNLKTQLVSDYLPEEVNRLKASAAAGDRRELTRMAESIARAKPDIESVQISAPLLNFSSSKDVVVKVVYSLADGSESRGRRTLYLLYRHGVVGNTWSYQHETTALSYYLNFG